MILLPKVNEELQKDFTIAELPTNTFKLEVDKQTVAGFVNDLQAMAQAIYLILSVERYENLIYSWNYGMESADLIGKLVPFVLPEIKRRVTEALMQDSRITGVGDFIFDRQKGVIKVTFSVQTIYGDLPAEKVVNI